MRDSRSYPAEGFPEGRRGRGIERLVGAPEAGADDVSMRLKGAAASGTMQALALVKSHYPFVDLKRIEAGFTVETDEAKFDQLLSEAEPITEALVDFMNIGDLE